MLNECQGINLWIMSLLYPVLFNELCFFYPGLVVSWRSSHQQKSISSKISWEAKRQVSWQTKRPFMTNQKKKKCIFAFYGPHTPVRWRFKSKKRGGMPSSASLDIYLNHPVGDQISNELSNQSDACPLSRSRVPHISTPCSLVENMTKPTNLSANLSIRGDSFIFLAFLFFHMK